MSVENGGGWGKVGDRAGEIVDAFVGLHTSGETVAIGDDSAATTHDHEPSQPGEGAETVNGTKDLLGDLSEVAMPGTTFDAVPTGDQLAANSPWGNAGKLHFGPEG